MRSVDTSTRSNRCSVQSNLADLEETRRDLVVHRRTRKSVIASGRCSLPPWAALARHLLFPIPAGPSETRRNDSDATGRPRLEVVGPAGRCRCCRTGARRIAVRGENKIDSRAVGRRHVSGDVGAAWLHGLGRGPRPNRNAVRSGSGPRCSVPATCSWPSAAIRCRARRRTSQPTSS